MPFSSTHITQQRLITQQIANTTFSKPADLVAWLGGVQAQDYVNAKWAIGLRTKQATDNTVEQAIADGTILRTWLMRCTLHIVAAKDIYWMLDLLAPRIISSCGGRYQRLELDEAVFKKSNQVIVRSLQGEKQLTRDELAIALAKVGIAASGIRLAHILQRASLEQHICFGARRGNEFTFRLLEERSSTSPAMSREQALAELAERYFTSHGPATLLDFVWWSGLSVGDAKTGIRLASHRLHREIRDTREYWQSLKQPKPVASAPVVYLLAGFDEYVLGYKDRSDFLDPLYAGQVATSNGIFNPVIVINGEVKGSWKRTVKKDKVIIETKSYERLDKQSQQGIISAAEAYGKFINKTVEILLA